MSVEGDLLTWSTVDYVDQGADGPDVRRMMEHVAKDAVRQEAFERGVVIGEIFYSAKPIAGVAGAIEYRAWSWIERQHGEEWDE